MIVFIRGYGQIDTSKEDLNKLSKVHKPIKNYLERASKTTKSVINDKKSNNTPTDSKK